VSATLRSSDQAPLRLKCKRLERRVVFSRFFVSAIAVLLFVCVAMKVGARKMSSRKMKDPAPKTTRDLRILNLKSARLFSSFLRGASYLKSPQNKFQKIEFLYRIPAFSFVNPRVDACGFAAR
jgi:hypothetical protein